MHVETSKNRVFNDNGANGTHDIECTKRLRLYKTHGDATPIFYRKPILTHSNTRTHTGTAVEHVKRMCTSVG